MKNINTLIIFLLIATSLQAQVKMITQKPKMKMTSPIPEYITTPDNVETSIGTLEFFDGTPTDETAQKLYDNLDLIRGTQVFLNALPAASLYRLRIGNAEVGVDECHKVAIFKNMMDSKSYYLTANTSTMYAWGFTNLKKDGPTVFEVPPGVLGALNDAWFQYVGDFGPFGQDKGKGGKYLILPPGYEGDVPDGYFVLQPKTYRNWLFLRMLTTNGINAALENAEKNMKIYPLSEADNPPATEFINVSGLNNNTVSPNDFSFYVDMNAIIQEEPNAAGNPETLGLLASIGIRKGKEFAPDERMKKILTEAVAIGNATARTILWHPRMNGVELFPGSSWWLAYANRNVFFEDDGVKNLDARTMFHYNYTVVTPAMAKPLLGKGSDYGTAYRDNKGNVFNGSKTYKVHIPANVPAKDFWALTLYDPQTRSQMQTDQQFPTVGSQDEGFVQNADGSYDVYFSPEPPKGMENNWLQTIPGKSWFVTLRIYGPLQPWLDKTWKPGEIELVK